MKENVVLSPEARSSEKFMHGIKVRLAHPRQGAPERAEAARQLAEHIPLPCGAYIRKGYVLIRSDTADAGAADPGFEVIVETQTDERRYVGQCQHRAVDDQSSRERASMPCAP